MRSFLKQNWLLLVIIFIAIALRFFKLSSIPIGFNDDEAAFGYNAYSIISSGRDEWGRFLPFPAFESFGDWKLVFYLYLTVISQFIFGTSEFATRFPSALFGVLTVIATYFLTKKLFEVQNGSSSNPDRTRSVALVAAFFLAISPWHVVAARNAFESDLLSFFITVATLFFLKSLKDERFLYISTILFAFCFYIYRSSWLFVPIFILVILYLHRENLIKTKRLLLKNIILILVLAIPLLPTVASFKGQSRFLQESFITGVSRIGITNEVNERRGICQNNLPKLVCFISYNKYVFFISSYIENYVKNLSYETFFDYSTPTGFQSFAKRSAFYLFELPLIALGIVLLLKTKSPAAKILIPWLVIAPIGAAITGIGNFGRINLIIPAPQIIAAFGLISGLSLLRNMNLKIFAAAALSLIILYSLLKFVVDLFLIEPFYTSRYQRFGYWELFDYLARRQNDYTEFVISRKIDNSHQYIQYLMSRRLDPNLFRNSVERERGEDGWVIMKRIGKFRFAPSAPGLETLPEKSLLVVGEKETSFPISPAHVIRFKNGDIGFEIYDVDQVKLKIRQSEGASK